ncbi:NADP-dependent oxidoreductase [Rhodococcus sp. 06-470-2]|uniref:NADP-dependent oxidoreductase n=1 Tax=unclassified Rhodococcus (in: high G+C Gram-positive bacteria) TaxID=192944 RepID=UPI000B9B5D69|nr:MULTISPECIES: NADP-dependent oxidoreductase [unclassified Rhodococcus (in: high G+C Gram-positive bacteria)]OZC59463.1 NADP-dependent oxidoreductase [Rhodococcus sp. 06-470-2]OZE57162.1 NADP-dependent oxidoreductase [Rhodococcus sp. 05-2221-1B]
MISRALCLAAHPSEKLTTEHLELTDIPLAPLLDGEVLVRNTWLSIDPSIRLRLGESAPSGYLPPLRIGDALVGLALGIVVESRHEDFRPGDLVSHMHGYRDFAVVSAAAGGLGGAGTLTRIDAHDWPQQWYLGPLGSSGLTAYVGLFEVMGIRPSDTVWISAAAGAVGSIATQLAVHHGCTVIASAGSRRKADHLVDALGASSSFDYHDGDVGSLLAQAAPDGIDAYFDNVGGSHFIAALDALNPEGRVVMCGAISTYETSNTLPSNLFQITAKSLSVRGFRAGSFGHLYDRVRSTVGSRLANGTLIHEESIYDGLEHASTALVDLLNGRTTGKTLCRL